MTTILTGVFAWFFSAPNVLAAVFIYTSSVALVFGLFGYVKRRR